MATTSISKSIPAPRKRARGLTITINSIINAKTPLAMGCFYGVLIALLLAALYPSISNVNLGAYLSSSVISGLIGGHITSFSSFTAFLGLELYSSFYGLLFGGIMAYIGGASLPVNIENGTLDLALARPISRTRYYLESWLGALICGAIIGLFTVFAAGLGMFLGSFINASRGAGGAAVGIIALGYLMNTFGSLSDQFNWLLKINPFYYAPAIGPLVFHQLTWWHPLVLVAAGLVFGIAGLLIFNRRDLPAV